MGRLGPLSRLLDRAPPPPAGAKPGNVISLTAQELISEFISLGEDCEFSFIQRRVGAEPLEMLRFAGTTLEQLTAGFEDKFAAVGDPAHTFINITPDNEVWCVNNKYGFEQHTFRDPATLNVLAYEAEQCKRLKFLRRKFMEDVESGSKTFVFKRRSPPAREEVAKLFKAMRRCGPASLLWVLENDHEHPAGTVLQAEPGFFIGYIDRFTPLGRAAAGSLNIWLTICQNVKRLQNKGQLVTIKHHFGFFMNEPDGLASCVWRAGIASTIKGRPVMAGSLNPDEKIPARQGDVIAARKSERQGDHVMLEEPVLNGARLERDRVFIYAPHWS